MIRFGFPIDVVLLFITVISISVFIDLFFHKKTQDISVLDAGLWSAFWVFLALTFYGYLWMRFDKQWADLYLAGVALEKSLSVDNLVVFMAIFSSFNITGVLQHKILYLGIIGALVFRALFVAAGTGLLQMASWVGFLFAAIVAWSGWKMFSTLGHKEETPLTDYSSHWSVRLTKKFIPIFPRLHMGSFFVTRAVVIKLAESDSRLKLQLRNSNYPIIFATPALLCLMTIETSDVMFAFDSVPAVIAVTQEPLLVYAAMIFAVLGLRSLYFVMAALTRYLTYLEHAVVVLLFFIAFKLSLQSSEHVFGWDFLHISPNISLLIILCTLTIGIVASLIWGKSAASKGCEGEKADAL